MKTVERLRQAIQPVIEAEGYELVDIEVKGGTRNRTVSVYIHKPGGVNFKDCANVSRLISPILDVEDPFEGRYMLEVASPGLDRPLKTESDFRRAIGETVQLQTDTPDKGRVFLTGEILNVVDGKVLMATNKGGIENPMEIPVSEIIIGKIEIKPQK